MKDKSLIKGNLLSKMRRHRGGCVVEISVGGTRLEKVVKREQYESHATVLAGMLTKTEKGQMRVSCQPLG